MPILLALFLPLVLQAKSLRPVAGDYKYIEAPEFQAIMALVNTLGEFKSQGETEIIARPMTRGEMMVEAAKARNRAIIAENIKAEKKAEEAGNKSIHEKWRDEVRKTHEGWRKQIRETRKLWRKEQDIFMGRIKEYQENTFDIPALKEKIIEVEVAKSRLPKIHIINEAFALPIRDQRRRATCAAFAGVRGVEILLAQNNHKYDLSSQYFYWASKPNCQKSPCQQRGSWVTPGYKFSQNFTGLDIPKEKNCPYISEPREGNETHLPLGEGCRSGVVKVEDFKEARTLAETIERLTNHEPVIMAAKLSWNFYKNEGLVTLSDSKKPSPLKLDYHSMGHAFLAVGVMELPEKVHEAEGKFCILIANSWGKGWGAGGYSCLTERWLKHYRQSSPFIAVTQVRLD